MKKVRYLILAVMLLPACEFAVTPSLPSESNNPPPLVSASVSVISSVTPSPEDSSNLNTNNTGNTSSASPLPSPTPTEEIPSNNNDEPTASPTPSYPPGPTPIPPIPKEPYLFPFDDRPVNPGIRDGIVSVMFSSKITEEPTITYNNELKKFVSTNNVDLTYLNSIVKDAETITGGPYTSVSAYSTYDKISNDYINAPNTIIEKRKVKDLPDNEKARMIANGFNENEEVYLVTAKRILPYSMFLKEADIQAIIYKLRTEPYVYTAFETHGVEWD